MPIIKNYRAIKEGDLPPEFARDLEYLAGDAAHTSATDPHSQYLLQVEGDARYRQNSVAIADTTTTGGLLSTTGSAQSLTNPSSLSRVGWGISDGNPFLFFINQFAPTGAKIFDLILDKLGKLSARRLDDSYSPSSSQNFLEIDSQGNISLNKNLQINGFAKFGGSGVPGTKIKTIEGTCGAENTYTSFSHGLSVSKISFCTAIVKATTTLMAPPNLPISGCTFSVYCHGDFLVMYLPPSTSTNVANKPFIATIIYNE